MPLPDLIEIIPLTKPVRAEITVPGSKSITNRALILAALAEGEVTLTGALWSEDTQVMVECLQELGFMVNVAPDPNEFCNRTITVYGQGGKVPRGGTEAQPLELFVGNAGTAARFLAAMVCLGDGVYRLHGVPRMHERPQAALFAALRQLGYRVESEKGNDRLPARIWGEAVSRQRSAISPTACRVSIEESSQFASALLLGATVGKWGVEIVGENAEESPYVAMTSELIKVFPHGGGTFQIEPDASSGSYFWAAGRLETLGTIEDKLDPKILGQPVTVKNWPQTGWQIDEVFRKYCYPPLRKLISRRDHLGDSMLTAMILAPFQNGSGIFYHLERLRVQECDRVVAMKVGLESVGVRVIETHTADQGDALEIFKTPMGEFRPAEIETFNDHRIAMCFAVLGLKVPGIKLRNPACVKKTFPNFFQKLAAAPPRGLGVEIRDGHTGRVLSHDELFAD
jgi:3-phosphoshikimate 1-carboxyvinyltransferase